MADWWHSKTWRFIQTNLREIDMLDIDSERVVADMQSFKANVLMINAAGIIASYPTKLPYHFQSPFLKGDSLQSIIAACHRADIRVMARTDFSKIRYPIYEAHPEWVSLTVTGEIVEYNGDVQVCLNGGYQQEYALRIIEELLTTHDFDGIFFNMGGYQTRDYSGNYHGICHCANCERFFFRAVWAASADRRGSRRSGVSEIQPLQATDVTGAPREGLQFYSQTEARYLYRQPPGIASRIQPDGGQTLR